MPWQLFADRSRPRRRPSLLILIVFGLVGLVPLVVAVAAAVAVLGGAVDAEAWGPRYGVTATIAMFGLANPVFTAFRHTTSTSSRDRVRGYGASDRGALLHVTPRSPWPGVIYLVATGVALLVSGPLINAGVPERMARLPILGSAMLSVLGVVRFVHGMLARAWRER